MSMIGDISIGNFVDGFKSRFNVVKVFDQAEKSAGCKHPPNLLTHFRGNDLTLPFVNFANCFQNNAQSIAGNMKKHGKIEYQPSRAFGYCALKQFMKLICRHFIEVTPRSNNERMISGFGLYAHILQMS